MITTGKRPLAALLTLALCAGLAGCAPPLRQTVASPSRAGSATDRMESPPGSDIALVRISDGDDNLDTDPVPVNESAYDALQVETMAAHTPALRYQLSQAAAINEHVVGWLRIPGTTVDTAIVQNPSSQTNDFYLQRDFYRREDKKGTYCADLRSSFSPATRQGLSTNTTLYAHSFNDDPDGELFSQLKKYRDAEFARTHPYIYFSTAGEDMAWEVFAVFDTTVDLPYVWPELPDRTASQLAQIVQAASLYNYGVTISDSDKILTLSTCTYFVGGVQLPKNVDNDYRFVVMARLVDPGTAWKETAGLTVNPAPLRPDQQPRLDLSWIGSF